MIARPPLARLAAALALLAAVVLLAACGGTSGPSTGATNGAGQGGATSASTSPPPAPAGGAATSLQQQYVQVVDRVGPQVVQISTDQGLGSGIVFDDRGDIVTNFHVVQGANRYQVTLANGKRFPATLVGAFPPNDLAVVRARGSLNVAPASFADSSKLQVGAIVLALGNPLGLRSSVTNGIVSALGRTVPEGGGVVLPDVIQTSAPINPGNSGGALVDLSGRVVGIPTLAAVDQELGGGAAPGIGFAISSNTARDIAQQIVQNGRVTQSNRAYLGVELATSVQGSGAVVGQVVRGGPADQAGIRAGDQIVSIAGQATPTSEAVATVLATLKPGQRVPVAILRPDGSRATVQVTLGQLPGTPPGG